MKGTAESVFFYSRSGLEASGPWAGQGRWVIDQIQVEVRNQKNTGLV